ncbi:4434_t:CDS:2, partial [Paraglomus occultum]
AKEALRHGISIKEDNIMPSFKKAFVTVKSEHPNYGSRQGMNTRTWWANVVKRTFIDAGVSEQDLTKVFHKLSDNLYDRFRTAEGYELYSETEEILSELAAHGIKLGVVSNSDERVHEVLSSLGLGSLLNFILVSSEFGMEKPAKQIFDKALELGEASCQETIHVGDDIENDYFGSKNAGLRSLLLRRLTTEPAPPSSVQVISSLREIRNCL